ncbi:PREDICTED: protein lethal(2)essential for life [Bactrocera latifrons]|uniref:Protein lethal(2)essential for life n=3 Tax=Bactrocera latifrons TaxID=174628 RepID=A0A0K8W0K1_BACLA|nr:PREDICTED: protein lethal(2)essential for life [Bactrocera latifrons]XP_018793666.1 PREDICTED: protein lethal(2)essential for life [Bactrocera latifrons]
MSVVPLMFRDWWDDFEFPTRTSRLLDQHFGTGLRRDDLLSSVWNSRPTMLRSGYLRPWQRSPTSLQKQESGSTLNIDNEKFEVILDVQQFTPNEITVKVTDKFVLVEGKHEERQDEHGFVSRQFSRRYLLPNDINPDNVTSSLSSDGLLTITAPMKKLPPPATERVVPISQTGPSSKEDNAKKIETTTA